MQNQSHLEVFSTAPAAEAMAALADKLPALQRELGVTRFVSQWDGDGLKGIVAAAQVDVTDRLLREFLPTPTENQRKTMVGLKKAKPLPLAEAKKLAEAGKL